MREWVEWSSQAIQALAVIIIVIAITFGSARFLLQWWIRTTDPYRAYKRLLGRSLLLALEFLVAADVIRTVLLDLTAKGMEILGALVAVRTFLSWSLVVELEGHWPWQSTILAARSERAGAGEGRQHTAELAGGFGKPAGWAINVPPVTSDGEHPSPVREVSTL